MTKYPKINSELLRKKMGQLGLNDVALAKAMKALGGFTVGSGSVGKWKQGQCSPKNPKVREALTRALNVRMTTLFPGLKPGAKPAPAPQRELAFNKSTRRLREKIAANMGAPAIDARVKMTSIRRLKDVKADVALAIGASDDIQKDSPLFKLLIDLSGMIQTVRALPITQKMKKGGRS